MKNPLKAAFKAWKRLYYGDINIRHIPYYQESYRRGPDFHTWCPWPTLAFGPNTSKALIEEHQKRLAAFNLQLPPQRFPKGAPEMSYRQWSLRVGRVEA